MLWSVKNYNMDSQELCYGQSGIALWTVKRYIMDNQESVTDSHKLSKDSLK